MDFGEENSPAAPAGIRTRNLSITSPALLTNKLSRLNKQDRPKTKSNGEQCGKSEEKKKKEKKKREKSIELQSDLLQAKNRKPVIALDFQEKGVSPPYSISRSVWVCTCRVRGAGCGGGGGLSYTEKSRCQVQLRRYRRVLYREHVSCGKSVKRSIVTAA